MALPRQSLLLWSVLVVALASCAGRGEIIGPGQGGTSGTSSGGSGGSVGGCGTGQAKCGSECKDLNADQLNCGACGKACGSGQTCQAGQCQCTAGLLGCNGACIPADASNCGSCNNKCSTGQVCSSNSCQSTQSATTFNGGALRVYHLPPSTLVTNSAFVASEAARGHQLPRSCHIRMRLCAQDVA